MYASKYLRLLSVYNKTSYIVCRQLVSSRSLQPIHLLAAIDTRGNSNLLSIKNENFFGCSLSTSSSPDTNHNVSTEKVKKKRRRILSDSSSDDNNATHDDIEK